MKAALRKDATLKVRMDRMTLNLLERASAYIDVNKSTFNRQSIHEKAAAVIAEIEKTRFTKKDWARFFEMIDHPPQPIPRMKKAAQKYKTITSADED
ncbi:MAG: hypothetical protein NPIRA01_16780 [Nitrospirales bacterium]|nr:MAG: hypothetical protein NPIRA01_16780 [Nitrospirales bacterium]